MSSSSSSSMKPRAVAIRCYDRIKDLDLTDINYRAEIRKEINSLSLTIPPDASKQFTKSAANHLAVLVKTLEDDPTSFDQNGEWIGMKSHQNQLLTDFEEALLCGILMSQRQLGKKITPIRAKQAASIAFGDGRSSFSKTWAKRFVKRNQDIFYLRKKRSMSSGRSSDVTYDQCELFCDAFADLLDAMDARKMPISPDTLCNMDETLLRINKNGRLEVELIPREEQTGTHENSQSTVIGSMLAFVTATGAVPYVYFCMKKEGRARKYPVPQMIFNREGRSGTKTSIYDAGDTWSETGYMSANHIEIAVKNFASIMKHYWGTKHPIILLADNLRQHQTLNVLELSAKNGIQMQFLTPNASHFLQPLDDNLFAFFKSELERTYDCLEGSLSALGLLGRNVLASVVPASFDFAFTPKNIRESWSNVGIWPFRRDIIMENALKSTSKQVPNKYTKHITFPFKKIAFDVAMEVNEKARDTVLKGMDGSFERSVGIRRKEPKSKKNSATQLFQATRGSHDLLLKHEREKKKEEDKLEEKRKEKKKNQESRKRKREDEEKEKETKKKEKERKKESEMRKFQERTCRMPGCKYAYDDILVRAKMWLACPCGKFYICPSHKEQDSGSLLMVKHQQEAHATLSKE